MNTICTIPWDVLLHWKRKAQDNPSVVLTSNGFNLFMRKAVKSGFLKLVETDEWTEFNAWAKALRPPQWFLEMSEEARLLYEATKDNGAGI